MRTNSFHNDWSDVFKSLRRGLMIVGGTLTVLALAILIFPWIAAFLLAAFLLTVGVSALAGGYRMRQIDVLPDLSADRPIYVEARNVTQYPWSMSNRYAVRVFRIRH